MAYATHQIVDDAAESSSGVATARPGVSAGGAQDPGTMDAARFTATLQPYLAFLRRYALRLTRNPADAEDLVQEVMIKLYTHRERLQGVQALQPWLARVTYYQNIDLQRRRPAASAFVSIHRLGGRADDEGAEQGWDIPDNGPGPERQLEDEEMSTLVTHAVKQLPATLQRLVQLHDIEGVSLPEISQRLGIPVNTLKSSLKRAKCQLRRSLRCLGTDRHAAAESACELEPLAQRSPQVSMRPARTARADLRVPRPAVA